MISLADTPAEEQREMIEFLRGADFHHPDSAPYALTAQGWAAIGLSADIRLQKES